MRLAAPYPVHDAAPIIRHRALGGRHAGRHELAPGPARTVNAIGLAVAAAAVPAAWWVLLSGAGIPTPHEAGPRAPAEQPMRRQVLPPITAAPPATGRAAVTGPQPTAADPTAVGALPAASNTRPAAVGTPSPTTAPMLAPAPTPDETATACPATTATHGKAGQQPHPTRSHPS